MCVQQCHTISALFLDEAVLHVDTTAFCWVHTLQEGSLM